MAKDNSLCSGFFVLGCLEDDEEDEEDEKAEGDGMVVDEETGEEEETDLELAWKVLDIARIIHAKEAERSLDEVDVIIALADISLERGKRSTRTFFLVILPFSLICGLWICD